MNAAKVANVVNLMNRQADDAKRAADWHWWNGAAFGLWISLVNSRPWAFWWSHPPKLAALIAVVVIAEVGLVWGVRRAWRRFFATSEELDKAMTASARSVQ